ncbi:TPA: SMI1/KNR4 family protein [Enterobacter kobei]|nr:SMI1/KNR4 family protein [Enterobacter kobei]
MLINKLVTILAVLFAPSDSGKGMKWPLIEDGLPFPSDYIEFINEYGSGRIADFILIFNPFSKNGYINFFEQYKFILEDFNYLIESDKGYYNYQLYPNGNGLIPLGVTDNGDYLFWVVNSKDNSELWTVAIIAARTPEVEYFHSGLTDFLEGLLKKTRCKSFPDDSPMLSSSKAFEIRSLDIFPDFITTIKLCM